MVLQILSQITLPNFSWPAVTHSTLVKRLAKAWVKTIDVDAVWRSKESKGQFVSKIKLRYVVVHNELIRMTYDLSCLCTGISFLRYSLSKFWLHHFYDIVRCHSWYRSAYSLNQWWGRNACIQKFEAVSLMNELQYTAQDRCHSNQLIVNRTTYHPFDFRPNFPGLLIAGRVYLPEWQYVRQVRMPCAGLLS